MMKTLDHDITAEELERRVEAIVDEVRKQLTTKTLPKGTIKQHESEIVAEIEAANGFGLMTPIGWEWGLGMWAYSLIWFVFNDAVKMAVLRFYHHLKGVVVEI